MAHLVTPAYAQRVAAGRVDPGWLSARYHADGATVDDIAAEAGLDRTTIYAALHEAGIALRGRTGVRSRARQLTRANLIRWLDAGESLRAIADRTGAHPQTVAEWVAYHGLAVEPDGATDLRRWYLAEGLSMAETAARAGCGVRTVRRRLLASGVTLRGRGRRPR